MNSGTAGMLQEQFVVRVADLERLLNAAALENLSIENDHTSVTDIARDLLNKAGWLSEEK